MGNNQGKFKISCQLLFLGNHLKGLLRYPIALNVSLSQVSSLQWENNHYFAGAIIVAKIEQYYKFKSKFPGVS